MNREILFRRMYRHRKTGQIRFVEWGIIDAQYRSPALMLFWEAILDEQYTGLQDVNGVKIFEGDVVNHQNQRIGQVWFDLSVGAWAYGKKPIEEESWYFYDCGGDHDPSDFRILGNIHDNSELLNE